MKFHLSDEQQELYDTVQRLLNEQGAGAARRAVDGEEPFDADLWRDLCELGVCSLAAPEEAGGLGLGLLDLAVIADAMGAAAAPVPYLGHTLAMLALVWAGTAAQKSEWLPKLASGEAIGTVALEEAGGISRPDGWTVSLTGGAVQGAKINVSCPMQADVVIVGCLGGELALVRGPVAKERCVSIDVVDRTQRLWNLDLAGLAAQPLGPAEHAAQHLCDAAQILLAADAVGGANRLFDMTVDFVKAREQFGGPIGRFQGVKHQLANLLVQVEPLRSLLWYAAYAFDRGEPDASRTASIAKAHATDVFMATAREAVQLHGGMGYTWDYGVQIWLKRAIADYALMGTPAQHRERAAVLAQW